MILFIHCKNLKNSDTEMIAQIPWMGLHGKCSVCASSSSLPPSVIAHYTDSKEKDPALKCQHSWEILGRFGMQNIGLIFATSIRRDFIAKKGSVIDVLNSVMKIYIWACLPFEEKPLGK